MAPRGHTIASLATKYKIQGSAIERAFQKAGLMTLVQETADTRCRFDAAVAEAHVEKLGRAIPIAKDPENIGCARLLILLRLKVSLVSIGS